MPARPAWSTIPAVSTVTPRFPQTVIEMPNFATDSAVAVDGGDGPAFRHSIAHAAYEEAGIGPEDVDVAEVYDLSSALELDWYEDIGLCKEGEAERLLRDGDTAVGGRIPVNPSGGLSCFGEAIPAQAIAQVCELVWQLRGQATGRQVEGARVGRHRQPGPLRPRVLGDRLAGEAGRKVASGVVAAKWLGAVAAWLGRVARAGPGAPRRPPEAACRGRAAQCGCRASADKNDLS